VGTRTLLRLAVEAPLGLALPPDDMRGAGAASPPPPATSGTPELLCLPDMDGVLGVGVSARPLSCERSHVCQREAGG
jgi:hypothetical protein